MDSTLLITIAAAIVVGLVILALHKKCIKNSSFDRALVGSMVLCAIVVFALVYGGKMDLLYAVLLTFVWWSVSVLVLGDHYEKTIVTA